MALSFTLKRGNSVKISALNGDISIDVWGTG